MQLDRETLGKIVRETWVNWASQQPEPKPRWLDSWDTLSEDMREVDRQIGEAVAEHVVRTIGQQPDAEFPYTKICGQNEAWLVVQGHSIYGNMGTEEDPIEALQNLLQVAVVDGSLGDRTEALNKLRSSTVAEDIREDTTFWLYQKGEEWLAASTHHTGAGSNPFQATRNLLRIDPVFSGFLDPTESFAAIPLEIRIPGLYLVDEENKVSQVAQFNEKGFTFPWDWHQIRNRLYDSVKIDTLLASHEATKDHRHGGTRSERVLYLLGKYREETARAHQNLLNFKQDVQTWMRALAMQIECAANAATHREKNTLLSGVIALTESAIQRLRDNFQRYSEYWWQNPDIFRSDYPVRRYIEQIRALEAEVLKLKGEGEEKKNETNPTQYEDIAF